MPVPENEEPGILSPQLQQQLPQSSNFSGAIPIKKRRFPVIRSPSPSPEEKCFSSEGNDSKDKRHSNSPEQGLSISAAKDMDYPGKVEMNKTFDLIVKKEQVTDTHTELGQDNVVISASKPQEANPGSKLGPTDDLRNIQNNSSNEKSGELEVPGSRVVAHISNVKQEIVSGKIEGTCDLELSTDPKNGRLLFGAKEPFIPALEHKITEGIGYVPGKPDLSLLSLSLSQEKVISQDNHNRTVTDVGSRECANRSNWDLNTTMDAWEGSVSNDAFAHETAGVGGLSKINKLHDAKSSVSAASVVGVSSNKGKQVLDEHSSNSFNSHVQPSQQHKPVDILGLSLAMPCRELDASGEHSSLSDNVESESVGPNFVWGREQQSIVKSAFAIVRNVKSEPVNDNSKRDCSTGNSSNTVLSKLGSVKKELVVNHNSETLLPSSVSPQNLDHKSIKSELVQEGTKETSKSVDAILLQSVGKIMQHQESSASSSVSSISLQPQNSCPRRFSTCLELPMSGDLSSQSEHSFPHKELHEHRNIPDERFDAMVSKSVSENNKQLWLCKKENLNILDAGKCELDPVNVHSRELCGNSEVAANDEEKINISAEMLEEDSFESDCESDGNHAFATLIEEKTRDKEDEEYEDGEVREQPKDSGVEDAMFEEEKTENVLLVDRDCRNVHSTIFSIDQNTNASDFNGKATVTENNNESGCDQIKGHVMGLNELKSKDKSLQKPLSEKEAEVGTDEKKSISVTPVKPLELDSSERKNANKDHEKEMSTVINESHGVEITPYGDDTDKVKEICPEKHDSTLSKVEASVNGNDAVKDSNSVANKSRIINLPRASVVTTPGKTRSLSSRLLTSRTGKERYSDFDGDIHPRGNRDELYIDGPNKFVKDRVYDQSFRNSRLGFMLGKGRVAGRFGPLHNEWDSDHDYAPETYNGSADYRIARHKHNDSSAADVELECNNYGITPDGTSLGGGRRKTMNDEMHSLRRPPLRRLSPGDREGPISRGVQMPRRFPRNISPSRCIVEDGSEFVGLRHGDKFMRHLSDDVMDPVFSRSQSMYDEIDGQLVRGNRNFSTVHRKVYPRISSKSPVRSRTRSPGPWSSPRRRSPTGLPELTQHRSPDLYRMGRMRSPDRACYRDEMVARRRASPSYITRHASDLREMDSEREHVHPRTVNSNRRSPPPGWPFRRSSRRTDVLDSRERAEGDEYSNGPVHSNKFQGLRNDGSMDERRKFSERRGLIRSFRPSYSGDIGNYHFHLNDGPRPYKFCQDTDTEFVERNNMREREFDGHIKHPPLNVPRRIRNEQQDGNHRPGGRVWHEDGFSDVSSVKRRRF